MSRSPDPWKNWTVQIWWEKCSRQRDRQVQNPRRARGDKQALGLEQRETPMCSGRLEQSLEQEVRGLRVFWIVLSVV